MARRCASRPPQAWMVDGDSRRRYLFTASWAADDAVRRVVSARAPPGLSERLRILTAGRLKLVVLGRATKRHPKTLIGKAYLQCSPHLYPRRYPQKRDRDDLLGRYPGRQVATAILVAALSPSRRPQLRQVWVAFAFAT